MGNASLDTVRLRVIEKLDINTRNLGAVSVGRCLNIAKFHVLLIGYEIQSGYGAGTTKPQLTMGSNASAYDNLHGLVIIDPIGTGTQRVDQADGKKAHFDANTEFFVKVGVASVGSGHGLIRATIFGVSL